MTGIDLIQFEQDYRALIASCNSLALATCSEQGEADASYAPFIEIENTFYVYVSRLAKHTDNMLRRRQASIMFIEPEAATGNPFARQRVIYNCNISEIDRQEAVYQQVVDILQNRFGEIVAVLRSLPDFHLLALRPTQGQYIAGFGKAFIINAENGALSALRP
jgi:putative heme iron utilization protein